MRLLFRRRQFLPLAAAFAALLAACNDDPALPDLTAPVVAITTQGGAGTWATNVAALQLAGTAQDDEDVVRVEWSTDRGASGTATGLASWSATVPLEDGANVVTVRALDEEGNAGTAQATVVLDTRAPQMAITSPNLEKWVATSSATYVLDGTASDDRAVQKITWSSSRGPSGTASGSAGWTFTAALQPGDNRLTVTAHDEAGNSTSDAFTVTYNPGVQIEQPVLDPGGILVGQANPVRVTAALASHPGLVAGSVRLLRVDAAGSIVAQLGALVDNGDLSRGDEILGDGVFSGIVTLNEAQAGQVRLRVSAQAQVGGATTESLSAASLLTVYTPVSTAELAQVTSTQKLALEHFQAQAAARGVTAALDSTAQWLAARPEVQRVSLGDEGTIEVEYKSGLLGGVSIGFADATAGVTQGGLSAPAGAPALTRWTDSVPRRRARIPVSLQTRGTPGLLAAALAGAGPPFAAQANPDEVQSRRVLIFDPFNAQFGEKGLAARQIIDGSDLKFEVTLLRGSQATVGALANMTSYGLVLLDTHGYGGEYIFTGETPTAANLKAYQGLLRDRKLAVFSKGVFHTGEGVTEVGEMYAVTSRFVRGLGGKFPRSIVVNSSCQSTKTNALWLAFRDKGASAYYGYSQDVWSGFAKTVWTDLVTKLVRDLKTAGESYVEQTDPRLPHAVFQRRGNEKAHFGAGLINGDFEAGSLQGWTPAGDGRVITRLGPQLPTGGSHMGIISTGLGYTTSTGSIRQSFRVASTDSLLTIRWNFLSEEFLEYVGSQYQDYFRVTLEHPGGTAVAFQRNIDQFNAQFPLTSVSPGIAFDVGGVYMTGWRTLTVDLKPYRGKVVTLAFAVGDVGDSVYDSAVLLDDVTVVTVQ
jgi:hypothetical protein